MILQRERHNAYTDLAEIPQQLRAELKRREQLKKRHDDIAKEMGVPGPQVSASKQQ